MSKTEFQESFRRMTGQIPMPSLSENTEGEGSRGGKVIGHTSSGKPIYQPKEHAAKYKAWTSTKLGPASHASRRELEAFEKKTAQDHNFTADEDLEAGAVHDRAADKLWATDASDGTEMELHRRLGNAHHMLGREKQKSQKAKSEEFSTRRLPGLHEGVKDAAYKDGMKAGEAVANVIRLGWAKRPSNDSLASWMQIVDEYVGEEFKEFVNDPQWLKGFQSALTGAFGKAMSLRKESRLHEGDMTVANTILKQMGGAGRLKAMIGANTFVGSENSVTFRWPSKKPSTGNAVKITLDASDTYTIEFMQVGKGGSKTVKKMDSIHADQLMDIFEEQTGLYLTFAPRSESKGFHHGTVRQWKNGRHMKNGSGWERMKTGRSLPLASKVPAVSAAAPGGIPAGPYGAGVFEDPSDFSRQAVPTRDMSAAIINAVAGRDVYAVGEALELYAQYLDGEVLDEGALAKMKMVFGKLLRVGAKPKDKPKTSSQNFSPVSPLKRERQGIHGYLARKKAAQDRGER